MLQSQRLPESSKKSGPLHNHLGIWNSSSLGLGIRASTSSSTPSFLSFCINSAIHTCHLHGAGLLSLGSEDVSCWIILCRGGCPWPHRLLRNIPGFSLWNLPMGDDAVRPTCVTQQTDVSRRNSASPPSVHLPSQQLSLLLQTDPQNPPEARDAHAESRPQVLVSPSFCLSDGAF